MPTKKELEAQIIVLEDELQDLKTISKIQREEIRELKSPHSKIKLDGMKELAKRDGVIEYLERRLRRESCNTY